jgi:hypothetical protein
MPFFFITFTFPLKLLLQINPIISNLIPDVIASLRSLRLENQGLNTLQCQGIGILKGLFD